MQGTYTPSYLVAISDLSLPDRAAIRSNIDQVLIANALRLNYRDNVEDLVVRDIQPYPDLGLATTDDWLVPVAGTAGTEAQYFAATVGGTGALPQAIGVYGVAVESVPFTISRLRLTQGPTSVQVRGDFQLEQLYTRLEPVGYFSEPIAFNRGETFRALVTPRLAFLISTQRVQLLSRIVEPMGQTISAPSV